MMPAVNYLHMIGRSNMTTASKAIVNDSRNYSSLVSVDGRTYPLKSASLNARAEGDIAATTLTQAYENPYQEALEVLYTLPLPADGAVTGYTIRLGNRVIRGEVRKREEAREEYRKALIEGRTAALLEQQRSNTFSQQLGNLAPGETAVIEIEVLQPLAFLPSGNNQISFWEYRFPTVVSVRYEGDGVPDAQVLDADRGKKGIPARLEATLLIADGPADRVQPHSPDRRSAINPDGGSCFRLSPANSLGAHTPLAGLVGPSGGIERGSVPAAAAKQNPRERNRP
jgi:Ca-activated chloride channel homolog